MAVFRIEKPRDYTVMTNHHLRDKLLSLKAKGLLSLPEEWDYTTKGLARICKDGIDSICAGVRELDEHGYVIRQRVRNPNGQLGAIEYTILEQPSQPEPGNPAQLNTNRSSKEKSKKRSIKYGRIKSCPINPQTPRSSDRKGRDRMPENTTYVRNIKKYLLVPLYNAPATIGSYYTSLVSRDGRQGEKAGVAQPPVSHLRVSL